MGSGSRVGRVGAEDLTSGLPRERAVPASVGEQEVVSPAVLSFQSKGVEKRWRSSGIQTSPGTRAVCGARSEARRIRLGPQGRCPPV